MNEQIISTEVPDYLRLNFLPSYFSGKFFIAENVVCSFMKKLCKEYDGAYWNYYNLSNGGCLMVPAMQQDQVLVEWNLNYFSDVMSVEAAAIAVNLFSLGYLLGRTEQDQLLEHLSEKYHALYAYARQHKEADLIRAVID